MAGAAFDMSGFQAETAPAPTPAPDDKAFDLSGFQPEAPEKPSFIKRAANAVRWTKNALSGVTDLSPGAIEKALDKKIGDIGYVDVPTGVDRGKLTSAHVQAFDVPRAANWLAAGAMAPFAGEYVAGAESLAGAGARLGALGAGTWASGKAQDAAAHLLENQFPSQSLHARLLKWLTEQGVGGAAFAPFLAMPAVLSRFGLGSALHDPGLIPEGPAETPPVGEQATGATPEPEKAAAPAAVQPAAPSEGGLAGLAPRPETEPEIVQPPRVEGLEPLQPELAGQTAPSEDQALKEQAVGNLARDLAGYPGGNERNVPVGEISTDPGRFQYKLNPTEEGTTGSLDAAKFNPNMAGKSLLWRDPEDNKLYAVNGHNRLARAKRDDFPYLPAQIADGGNSDPDAFAHNMSVEDVRALGALQNIANKDGTAVDAAKFLRDSKASAEDLKAVGLDMNAKMTRDALALQNLDRNIFHFVTIGEIEPGQGVVIGTELADSPRGQEEAFRWLKKKEAAGATVTNDLLRATAREIRDAGETTGDLGQGGLFGEDFAKRSLYEERGQIRQAVESRLGRERAAFGGAVRNKAQLEEVGNVLTSENKILADRARNRLTVLDDTSTSGPVAEALNAAARELAEKPRNKSAIIDQAYEAITKAADEKLASAPPAEPSPQADLLSQGAPKKAKAPAEPGFTLGVSLPGGPQLAAAIEPEIQYWSEKFAEGGKGWMDAVRATFAPQTLGPLAKRASEIFVEARGRQAAAIVPDEVALMPLRAEMEKIPEADWRRRYDEFYGPYEQGQPPANLPPKLRPLIGRVQDAYEERLKLANQARARRGKRPIARLDNYLTHLYADDPAKVRDTINAAGNLSGKPLTRGTPFLNERKYLDIRGAMRSGLTPRYKNPIDMIVAGLRQFDAYIMAETMFQNMQDAGLLRFVKTGQRIEGFEDIPDGFFKVRNYDEQAGGIVERGSWQAPKEVVPLLRNHLLPSVASEDLSVGGRFVRHFGAGSAFARFNAFRVGFSTFHFLNENNSSYAQLQGTGIARALNGLLTLDSNEMRNGMRLFAKGVEPVGSVAKLFSEGDKMMRALVQPGTQGAEYDRAVEAAVTAGMRVKPEQVGTLAESLGRAANEILHPLARDQATTRDIPPLTRVGMAALREPGKIADLSSTALMNHWVPRVKLGAFYKLASQEFEHYTKSMGGNIPWTMQRQILQDVAAHVDSVFGQMVEDNLFMSRTMKDLLHVGIAYPGWNIGSLRILLNAAKGTARGTYRAIGARGMNFESIPTQERLGIQFALGMVTSQGIQNALLMRMLAGKWPSTIQDLFQPQDGGKDPYGNPTRIAPPSYSRTYTSIYHHPVSWAQNVANPVWGAIDDVVNNRERFTGRQLVDPQAPLSEQTAQFSEYLFRFALPFSVSNVGRFEQEGPNVGRAKQTLGVLGYSPVPAQYLRTEAENYVVGKAGEKAPRVGLNERQYQAKQAQIALEDAIREKKPLDASHKKALDSLDPSLKTQVEADAAKAAQLPRIVNLMRRMPLHEVIDTYEIAERNGDVRNMKYAKIIIGDKAGRLTPEKWRTELEKLDPGTRDRYEKLLREIMGAERPAEEAAAGPPA